MKTPNKRKTKKRIGRKIFKSLTLMIISVIVLITVAGSGVIFAIIKTAPTLDVNQILDLTQTSVIYDSEGNVMDDVIMTDTTGNVIRRTIVDYKDISDYYKKAVVSVEDERFWKHNGLDYKRLISITFSGVKKLVTNSNSNLQGGSTITQQLIKNRLFLQDSLTNRLNPKRKIQEMYLALQLEKKLTKEQILNAYMNTIYLGGTAYGVEAAAQQYFSTSAKDLNLVQSAFIAGIAQLPYTYYPFLDYNKEHPEVYINRTITVLKQMKKNDPNNSAQYDAAIEDVKTNKITFKRSSNNINKYSYEWFSRPVIQQVKKDLKEQYNYTDADIQQLLVNGGLKIYTTMDRSLEDAAQKVLDTGSVFGNNKKVQASAVVMDYHTGYVLAMIGGRFLEDQPANSYNRAYSINTFHRPTGSSIKPITVYGAAIDSKLVSTGTVLNDAPLDAAMAKKYGSNGVPYQPKNDTKGYSGLVTVREAIRRSINVIAVKIEDMLSPSVGASYAEKFGITMGTEDKRSTSIAAMALGQLSYGTDTYQMAAAYGVFGNNGLYTAPRLYTKVVDESGKTILESKLSTSKAISAEAAYITYDLLKEPVGPGGTGTAARFSNMVRGKTGTATDKKDLWFCGLTPYYSGAVWVGNDDNSKFSGMSSNSAANLWGKIMTTAHKGLAEKTIAKPANVVTATVCKISGKLDNGLCSQDPTGSTLISDLYIKGVIPTELCDQHVSLKINKLNGYLATDSTPLDLVETKIFRLSQAPTIYDTSGGSSTPTPSDNTNTTPTPSTTP